jgi:C4-dicarboxylate transporter DctM subunit
MKVPIGASMGIASIIGFILIGFNLATVGSVVYTAVSSQSLMCIPGYILAGAIMSQGGIADALVKFMRAWIGHLPGGLAIVTVVACAFFAAITGSSAATIAAVGGLMIPAMLDANYDKEHAMGCVAGAGSLGILIPPSIPMVLYATISGVSVAKLFASGMTPGILVVLLYAVYCTMFAKKRNQGLLPKTPMKDRWGVTVRAIPAILLPVTILGSIYGGIMTATESSAWACVYAILVSVFIYKGFTLKSFGECVKSAVRSTSSIFFIIVGCSMFSLLLTTERIPQLLLAAVTGSSISPMQFVLICDFILLILGMFLEGSSIMLVAAPLMAPVVASLGFDMLQFGIIMTIGIEVGQMTPPVGINLFIVAGMQKESVARVIKGNLPFLVILICVWILVTLVPGVSVLLPRLMYGA